ncbi:endonuclease-like protein [Bajunvirus bajun]|uniref:Endonuclease-like protein n=1 Tax=Brevundimonas phage vB_BgoS-Bajun TaxID=2948594 RepID=A0A9E7N7J2_9CAUD|nr:endonuclease-like protein [Brevundimonas phage vB_BgoS-Bajun]
MASINFRRGFDEYVANHQKVWAHDRSQSLGASSAFGCLRKAWFEKNGAEKDPDYEQSWGALQRGDLIEQHFVEPATKWFLEHTTKDAMLIWGGDNQKTLIDGRLSATPDGLVIYADDDALMEYGIPSLGTKGDPDHPSACFAFEIKSIDPRVNLKEEKSVHRGQTIVQMGLMRKQTSWKPNYAVIIYIDCSFFDDIEVFVVPYNHDEFVVAQQRAEAVFEIKDPATIMAEGKIDGTCTYCPFKVVCAKTNQKATPTKGEANSKTTPSPLLAEFERLVVAERVAASAAKAAEAEKKATAEKLKQWFRDTGVKSAKSSDGMIKASISWIKGRKTLDVPAMREAGIPVDDFMKDGEGHDRLAISERGPAKADAD